MRHRYYLLLLALATSGTAFAQTAPGAPDEQFTSYLATRTSRPQVYVGVQAAMPVYWRELAALDETMDWDVLGAFAGVRFNQHWAAQVGFNLGKFWHSYDIIPGLTGPAGPGQPTGTGRFSSQLAAAPVQVRFCPGWQPVPQWTFEAFAGLTPQWQRFDTSEATALPGQALVETTTSLRTTNLYATVGLAGVVGAGPGAEVVVEAALNRRSYTSGAAPFGAALVPTAGVGFRYRFGSMPRHTSYL